jgi:hypothetical protein
VSFAKDLEGTGVTVNILVPGGPTDTPGFFPPGNRPTTLGSRFRSSSWLCRDPG